MQSYITLTRSVCLNNQMGDLIQAPPWKKWVIISFVEDQMHLSKVGLLAWYAAPTSTLWGLKNSDGSTPVYIAAIVGNEAGVEILVRRNRDLMSDKDKEGHTPLHQMSKDKGILKTIKDSYGNNLLHLVGRFIPYQQIESNIRVALQMQRELQWFKEVEGFVCPLKRHTRANSRGNTFVSF